MNFDDLPKTFVPQKPHQQITPGELIRLGEARFIIQRKRDGQGHVALVTNQHRVKFYSRTGNEVTDKFPQVVANLADLDLPARTIIAGEVICDRRGVDDLRATNEVCRALPRVASMAERRLPIAFMPFDLLFYRGYDTWKHPYEERFEQLIGLIGEEERIMLPEVVRGFKQGTHLVRTRGWEGLVLWERGAPNKIRMDGGQAYRHGCYKWLPVRMDDFIATGWNKGTGKHAHRMGSLDIGEWQDNPHRVRPTTRTIVNICTVGTGFSDAERTEAMTWKYPMVVTLGFKFQQPDTRALREPRFIRRHPDKTVKEMR